MNGAVKFLVSAERGGVGVPPFVFLSGGRFASIRPFDAETVRGYAVAAMRVIGCNSLCKGRKWGRNFELHALFWPDEDPVVRLYESVFCRPFPGLFEELFKWGDGAGLWI